jgi:hypothetical protein
MKAQLRLERIGDDTNQALRAFSSRYEGKAQGLAMPWVAEITGGDRRYGIARRFLPFDKDFSSANSIGSRGVMACYILESGKPYEVFARTSWKSSERYFCRVTESGEIEKITKDFALSMIQQPEIDELVTTLKKKTRNQRA